ncbi:hypothetical protein [Cytobacillus horneckiae]|uniref:hypothetical protein n=1 Tax=Cytobacillus horneckiae TaxID=549687 RepID=UPI003D257C20
MLKNNKEASMLPLPNEGLYRFSLPYFFIPSVEISSEEGHKVYSFPVEAYLKKKKDLVKGFLHVL